MWVKSVFSKYSWEKMPTIYCIPRQNGCSLPVLTTLEFTFVYSHGPPCSPSECLFLYVLRLWWDNLTIASIWPIPPGSTAKRLQWAGSTPCTINSKCCALEQVQWSGSPWRICGPIRHPIWSWLTLYVTMGASPWPSTFHVGGSSKLLLKLYSEEDSGKSNSVYWGWKLNTPLGHTQHAKK